jgi:hypothetical protein
MQISVARVVWKNREADEGVDQNWKVTDVTSPDGGDVSGSSGYGWSCAGRLAGESTLVSTQRVAIGNELLWGRIAKELAALYGFVRMALVLQRGVAVSRAAEYNKEWIADCLQKRNLFFGKLMATWTAVDGCVVLLCTMRCCYPACDGGRRQWINQE